MHTLRDVVERVCTVPASVGNSGEWPRSIKPRSKLHVPGERALLLPGDLAGLRNVDGPGRGVPGLSEDDARAARSLLIASPGLVIPLEPPTDVELRELGLDPSGFRHENARALILSVCVKVSTDNYLIGVSRLVAVENGLRMGSTLLLSNQDVWCDSLEAAEDHIIVLLDQVAAGVEPRPEPNAKPWKKVVALLGGDPDGGIVKGSWERRLKIMAGLREISLEVRINPEAARKQVIQELRTRPPNALLVWVEWVAHPEAFIQPFLAARPGAKADLLGTSDKSMTFDEHVTELSLHLRDVPPLLQLPNARAEIEEPLTWDDVAPRVLELAGPHFLITDRAREMLKGNPYPKPSRMLQHLEKLGRVALAYFESAGDLGMGLSDFAMSTEGIEIALFDSGLSAPALKVGEFELHAIPHVKVDDYKGPDECGRIYFALDKEKHRFVVDHVGLHDYG